MGHRYIGSKSKILDDVLQKIEEITPKNGVVCDLMCGTSSVSKGLKDRGFSVIAADVMTYSYHHARVSLLINKPPKFSLATEFINKYSNESVKGNNGYKLIIEALNNVKPKKGYFFKEFSNEGSPKESVPPRNYFSASNAQKIDSIRFWIRKLHIEGRLNDLEHSLLLNDLILAANDVANISGTYGHYLSKLMGRANDPITLKTTDFSNRIPDKKKHIVMKGYAEELAKDIDCDVCYIDPPYMKRQYAANYHVLETLAREDSPEAVGVSGLRPWRDQYSNFCTKTKIRGSFDKIFSNIKCKKILLSYSEDGLLSIGEMVSFFENYGKVTVETIKNRRFRSNASQLDKYLNEYLIEIKLKS